MISLQTPGWQPGPLRLSVLAVIPSSLFSLYPIFNKFCTFHFMPPFTPSLTLLSSQHLDLSTPFSFPERHKLGKEKFISMNSNGYSGKYSSLLFSQETTGLHSILSLEFSVSSLRVSTRQQWSQSWHRKLLKLHLLLSLQVCLQLLTFDLCSLPDL